MECARKFTGWICCSLEKYLTTLQLDDEGVKKNDLRRFQGWNPQRVYFLFHWKTTLLQQKTCRYLENMFAQESRRHQIYHQPDKSNRKKSLSAARAPRKSVYVSTPGPWHTAHHLLEWAICGPPNQ